MSHWSVYSPRYFFSKFENEKIESKIVKNRRINAATLMSQAATIVYTAKPIASYLIAQCHAKVLYKFRVSLNIQALQKRG